MRYVARQGHGKNRTRPIMIGRRKLAKLLGLDPSPRRADEQTPAGQGCHDPGGTNTRRRLERCEDLGLFTLVGPVIARGDQLVRARGGRKRGCSSAALVGRAIRIYPGRDVYAQLLIRKQIEFDDLADAGLIEWTRLSTPREQLTPGQVLELEELGRMALRRRGPP